MFARRKSIPLVLLLALALPAPALAGPAWLALEYPVNPHNPATRGALATVRTYHHELSMAFTVRGILEGRVGGRHVTRDVEVVRLDEFDLYAVRGEVPQDGAWVLRLTLLDDRGGTMGSALAAIAADGTIGKVQVPFDMSRDGWTIPREARPDEIAALLAWSEKMAAVVRSDTQGSVPTEQSRAGLWALLLVPLGAAAARRVWTARS
jgi:hypothetical protein